MTLRPSLRSCRKGLLQAALVDFDPDFDPGPAFPEVVEADTSLDMPSLGLRPVGLPTTLDSRVYVPLVDEDLNAFDDAFTPPLDICLKYDDGGGGGKLRCSISLASAFALPLIFPAPSPTPTPGDNPIDEPPLYVPAPALHLFALL